MTGFDTYIYTNCGPDEGLAHREGFQFQAVSQDADSTAMAVIKRDLLYEPPSVWMRERRPVSQYPQSLAHVGGPILATAAGVYLGRERHGGREGNQLTHAITSSDPASYGLIRPAQLFGAPFWTTAMAAGKVCPPLRPGWRPGPFGVPEAQQFVSRSPGGPDLLAALLAELRRPGREGRRVLFLARRAEPVLRWIVAATLLVPQRVALQISFKVFSQNPAYSDHRIMAVHPDWWGGGDLGFAVFDLESGKHPPPEAGGQAARRWVELFLTEDPYDVTDAVEAADQSRLPEPHATVFATAVALSRAPAAEQVPVLLDWLSRAPAVEASAAVLRRHGPALVAQLRASTDRWTAADLARLDAATSRHLPECAAGVRADLLRAELDEVRARRPPRADRLPAIADPEAGRRTVAEVERHLGAAMRDAPPEMFESLLRLATRFRSAPDLSRLEPGVGRFLAFWADHPDAGLGQDRWSSAAELSRRLRAALSARLAAEPDSADRVGDQWLNRVVPDPQLPGPLDEALIAAMMARGADSVRLLVVDRVLRAAHDAPDPHAAFTRATRILWRRTPPGLVEVERLCGLNPPDLTYDGAAFRSLGAWPDAQALTDDQFKAADLLTGRGVWRPPAAFRAVLAVEAHVRQVAAELTRREVDLDRLAGTMAALPEATVLNHFDRLLEALLRAPLAVAVDTALKVMPQLGPTYLERVARRVSEPGWQPAQMAMAFLFMQKDISPVQQVRSGFVDSLGETVVRFISRSSGAKLTGVEHQIDNLDPGVRDRWDVLKQQVRPSNPLRRFRRG